MTDLATPVDHQPTGTDILQWYMEQGGSYPAAAEAMARDLTAAWAEVEKVRGQFDAARRLVVENVSRGYARAALPLPESS